MEAADWRDEWRRGFREKVRRGLGTSGGLGTTRGGLGFSPWSKEITDAEQRPSHLSHTTPLTVGPKCHGLLSAAPT